MLTINDANESRFLVIGEGSSEEVTGKSSAESIGRLLSAQGDIRGPISLSCLRVLREARREFA
jgi:hypothetical protein